MSDDWGNAVGEALYGDRWNKDFANGISDLVPFIDELPSRLGWEVCVGGDEIGHRVTDRNMCKACGALFAPIPSGYVPRHDAPTVSTIVFAAEAVARHSLEGEQ